jgi:hypothetical protein
MLQQKVNQYLVNTQEVKIFYQFKLSFSEIHIALGYTDFL